MCGANFQAHTKSKWTPFWKYGYNNGGRLHNFNMRFYNLRRNVQTAYCSTVYRNNRNKWFQHWYILLISKWNRAVLPAAHTLKKGLKGDFMLIYVIECYVRSNDYVSIKKMKVKALSLSRARRMLKEYFKSHNMKALIKDMRLLYTERWWFYGPQT